MSDFVIGGPVTLEDFMFRKDFINDLWESLRKNNILLLAPRRMGKTSVMHYLLEKPEDDWLVVYLNVEDLENPGDFCLHLFDAINEYHSNFLKQTISKSWNLLKDVLNRIEIESNDFKVALKESGITESWKEHSDQLIKRINKNNQKVLFLIDELPDMLNRMHRKSNDEFETFLHWFRNIRINPKSKIRWLIAGSSNIQVTLNQKKLLSLVNDLNKEILPPFTPQEVNDFVTRMLTERKVNFDPGIVPTIRELLGNPIPFFLQLLTQEIYRYWKRHDKIKITSANVIEVFENSLLGERARDKLQHLKTRIDLYYPGAELEVTHHILDKLSLTEDGISRNSLFDIYKQFEEKKSNPRRLHELKESFYYLLLMLEDDFYINATSNEKLDFSNKLLKRWWKKYYGYKY